MTWSLNTETGLIDGIEHRLSSNCDDRPDNTPISLLVIHNISLPPKVFDGNAVSDFFLNQLDIYAHPYFEKIRGVRVSAHFFIRREGEVIQFVPCIKRAWHAGLSSFNGRQECNDFSIGIELEGSDDTAFTDPQYKTLAQLTRLLEAHYPITDRVGHSDIAPNRKTDPGPFFDWQKFIALI
jgi:AmpD protein